jgi:CHAT domain-containing protein/tetratricopeptide (TPR) repeat protein
MKKMTAAVRLGLVLTGLLPAVAGAAARPDRLLVPGRPVDRTITSGQQHAYAVDLRAGDLLRLSIDQKGANVATVIHDPRGQIVLDVDLADFRLARDLASIVASAAGRYRILIRTSDRHAPPAGYTLTCLQRRSAAPGDDTRLQAERAHAEGKTLERAAAAESYRKAIAAFDRARDLWREAGDADMEAAATLEAARSSMALGDFAPAQERARAALEIWKRLGSRVSEARVLHLLGEMAYHRSDYPAALDLLRQALAMRQELGDRWGQAETQGDLSVVLSQIGRTDESLELARSTRELWHVQRNVPGEEQALSVLGYAHYQRGEWQPALDLFLEALPLKRMLKDREGEGATLVNIGTIYFKLGEPARAADFFEQALEVWRVLGNRKGEGSTLNNLGLAFSTLGRTDDAIDHYQRALVLRRAVGDRSGESATLVNLAAVELAAGRTGRAEGPLQEAMRILDEIGERSYRADARGYQARIHALCGESAEARTAWEEALAAKREVGDRSGEITALYHLARLARDTGDLDLARTRAEEAVSRVESMRTTLRSGSLRASYAASLRDVYDLYIDVLTRQHERDPQAGLDAEALRASERARARSLFEMLLQSRAEVGTKVDASLRARERSLQDRLALKLDQQVRLLSGRHTDVQAVTAAREVEALSAEYDDVRARLRSLDPHYAALTQPEPFDVAALQKNALDDDTVLLEYALGRSRSVVWAVTARSLEMHFLPGTTALEPTARRAMERLARRRRSPTSDRELSQALAELSHALLAPVAAALEGRRVVVVPDGILHYVPFAALPDPKAEARPLVAGHEVVTLPSAAVLSVLREELGTRAPAPKTLAVLADPVFERTDERLAGARASAPSPSGERDVTRAARAIGIERGIPRLPFTRREARAILSLVPKEARKEALDFDASRSTATAPELGDYRLVHFATHGFVNAARPDLSGIVLSLVGRDGRDQNGFLAAPEVFNLRLGADLVVLSGCRTGLGRELRGEGLVGLTRAFMYAGAPRVLASLWKVDDAATAELMTRVYRGILAEGRTPSEALRRAQVDLATTGRWRHPYFWAAFQLHGDWKAPAAR